MTDREAIERFESDCENCFVKDECTRMNEKGKLACRNTNAISALQEREERSKGCEYCNGNVDERPFLDSKDLYISEDGWLTLSDEDYDFCEINFCPMCGRKLKTAMPEEEI